MFTKIYNHLTAALREVKGVIDLASILVGVVVIGVVGGGILATVTMVIPFAQDESTKSDLAAVQLAQSTAYVLEERYLTTSELVDDGYLSGVAQGASGPSGVLAVQQLNLAANLLAAGAGEGSGVESLTDPAGTCYVASALSPTGTTFVTTSSSPEITASDRAHELSVSPDCLPALAGIAGDDWIGVPELAGAELTGTVGEPFTETLAANGGGDLTYEITAGDLPAGVALTDGTLSGTPTSAGLYTFTVTATNESGSADAVVTASIAAAKMVSTWDTSIPGCETIILPLGGAIDATVDWGDGTTEEATSNISHTYSSSGEQTVTVEGSFGAWGGTRGLTPECVTAVTSWGETGTTNLYAAFHFAHNFKSLAEIPSGVTNIERMFFDAQSFNDDVSGWDTSEVTNMKSAFLYAYDFNSDLSGWDTSKVTDMSEMFTFTRNFNSDLSGWDTSNVTDMHEMFDGAEAFHGDISTWDTSKVTDMSNMFEGVNDFNSDLSGWDTSQVTNMEYMFKSAYAFNQDLSTWDTSKVTNMKYMFHQALAFNHDISNWDVGNVTDSGNFRTQSALTAAHSPF